MTQLDIPDTLTSLRSAARAGARKLNISRPRNWSWFDVSFKTLLVGFYVGLLWLAVVTGALFDPLISLYENPIGRIFMISAGIYTTIMMLALAVKAIVVMFYKPWESVSDAQLPTVTVIIPAYNEGPDVAKTIESILASDYPREKMQLICIDDGSKDDTWQHIDRVAQQYPESICAIHLTKNGGKRHGMRIGFALAAGDVLVTADSDCIFEPQALRNLVTPLVVDQRIGAVAGNIKVQNRSAGVIPRMLRAGFVQSFDFARAYQSKIRCVQCTPGAFSAYRRSAVDRILPQWVDQKFLGKPSTIAEDRAITNLLLRDGFEVVFQSNATAWTNVPVTYKGLAKMYMRWERGNVRENLTYATFCWKRFRKRYWMLANLDFVLLLSEEFLPYILIAASMLYMVVNPFFALKYLAFVVLFSAVMQLYYIKQEKNSDFIYGILYSLFYFTALWWVVPYSIATAANGSWMTRALPATEGQPAIETAPILVQEPAGPYRAAERFAA